MKIHVRTLVRAVSFSLAIALVLSVFCLQKQRELVSLREAQTTEYRKAYWTLIASLESIEASLEKASVCSSPELLALLSGDIWNKAETAEAALAELPVSSVETSHTSDFLNKTGSYAYYLASIAGRKSQPTSDVRDTVIALHRAADAISSSLSSLSPYIYETDFFDAFAAVDTGAVYPTSWGQGLVLLESAFPETPTLLYDGPFSEHLTASSPLINRSSEVPRPEVVERAAALFGVSPASLHMEEADHGTIPSYHFTLTGKATYSLRYSIHGGRLLSLLYDGPIGGATLDTSSAIASAEAFLSKAGYSSLRHSYFRQSCGVLYINFVAEDDGVILYPDLIQIGISLADGNPVYLDATGYLSNHKARTLLSPSISVEDAKAALVDGLFVENAALALIPTEGKDELLCYEFLCRQNDIRYLIYIHAETGTEEKILILQENESGTLTF